MLLLDPVHIPGQLLLVCGGVWSAIVIDDLAGRLGKRLAHQHLQSAAESTAAAGVLERSTLTSAPGSPTNPKIQSTLADNPDQKARRRSDDHAL